jgi:hypothetical protein
MKGIQKKEKNLSSNKFFLYKVKIVNTKKKKTNDIPINSKRDPQISEILNDGKSLKGSVYNSLIIVEVVSEKNITVM